MKDKIIFDSTLSNRNIDENGYLHVSNCNITKETVNPYLGKEIPTYEKFNLEPDKIYYGYRKGEELKKAVNTFNGIPLLNEHIVDSADDPQKEHRCGALGTNAKWQKPYIVNSIIVYNQEDIDEIESEDKKELSSAYRYEPIFESGEFEGQHYDFIMTDIRANHVAIVEDGRAGSDVVVADSNINIINNKKKEMVKEKKFAMDEVMLEEDNSNNLPKTELNKAEHQEDIIEDEEVDKRKLIDEVVGFLKSKGLDDETIKFVIGKMETEAYNKSSENTTIDEEKDEICGDKEQETKNIKTAMDGAIATGKNQAINHFKSMYTASNDVKNLVGNVDVFAFDSAEDIYKFAIKEAGLNPANYKKEAYKGIVDVLNMKQNKVEFAMDSVISANEPDYLKKAKNFKRG